MHCLNCQGPLEYAQQVKFARCTHCLALFQVNDNGPQRWLTPLDVRAPNGQVDPAFTAMYAQQLGFAPRQANFSVVNVGGVGVKLNTGRMEREIKNKISGWIWGLIIGAFILLCMAGVLVYVFVVVVRAANDSTSGASATTTQAAKWDGKSPFTCGGNDNVKLEKVTAKLASGTAVTASGNCQVTVVSCDITAPVGFEAEGNAKITVTGGSVTSTENSAIASANAKVDFLGTTVKGPTKASGNGKVTGAK